MDDKLSDAQLRWLKKAVSRSGMGAGDIDSRTPKSLEKRGLAKAKFYYTGQLYWVITDAGRAVVAQ